VVLYIVDSLKRTIICLWIGLQWSCCTVCLIFAWNTQGKFFFYARNMLLAVIYTVFLLHHIQNRLCIHFHKSGKTWFLLPCSRFDTAAEKWCVNTPL